MTNEGKIGLNEYNLFCKGLRAGNILYNINAMNLWGDYLLVANVVHIRIGNADTYTVLLLGLKKEEGKYIPRNLSISLTPEHMSQIPFLKHVGYSKFTLTPVFDEIKVDVGLATVYSQVDLHKFVSKLSIRKPRSHKYGKDGKPIIKKPGNK
jgi:hypothetical protein